jgi:hypothetical protein
MPIPGLGKWLGCSIHSLGLSITRGIHLASLHLFTMVDAGGACTRSECPSVAVQVAGADTEFWNPTKGTKQPTTLVASHLPPPPMGGLGPAARSTSSFLIFPTLLLSDLSTCSYPPGLTAHLDERGSGPLRPHFPPLGKTITGGTTHESRTRCLG